VINYNNINKPFWIAHSDDLKIVHYGELQESSEVGTDQPNILSYVNKSEWVDKLKTLKIEI
tara:strand:- start:12 stop:194 length:183 start_codon:yes stop_codon:yes gene_type:complete